MKTKSALVNRFIQHVDEHEEHWRSTFVAQDGYLDLTFHRPGYEIDICVKVWEGHSAHLNYSLMHDVLVMRGHFSTEDFAVELEAMREQIAAKHADYIMELQETLDLLTFM